MGRSRPHRTELSETELRFVAECPHCGGIPILVRVHDDRYPYRPDYGPIWVCGKCDAYVGCHAGTTRPKGFLANAEYRELRKVAHGLFDPIWKSGAMTRKQAYARLAQITGVEPNHAHISQLNVEQLHKLIRSIKLRNTIEEEKNDPPY